LQIILWNGKINKIMIYKKTLGYCLVVLGLFIILGTLYGSYNIFMGKVPAPEMFKDNTSQLSAQKSSSQDPQAQIEEMIKNQMGSFLPQGGIAGILNLVSWSILAGILILGGGQISGIGTKLLKD
jgi:hypothetical protein